MANKVKLSREEITHLAKLAALKLSDEEIKKYQKQLDETLSYVDNLKELNTEKVQSTNQITSLKNTEFTDGEENKRALTSEEALKNSKSKKNGYFIVKRIM